MLAVARCWFADDRRAGELRGEDDEAKDERGEVTDVVEDRGEVDRIETSEEESCRLCCGTGGIGMGMPDGRDRLAVGEGEVEVVLEAEAADDPLVVRRGWAGGVWSDEVEVVDPEVARA